MQMHVLVHVLMHADAVGVRNTKSCTFSFHFSDQPPYLKAKALTAFWVIFSFPYLKGLRFK